ncbi:MAG: hypothetical protein RSD45_06405, partial [Gordonibacter sp.]
NPQFTKLLRYRCATLANHARLRIVRYPSRLGKPRLACLFRLDAGPNRHTGAGSIRAACHDSRIVLLVCLLRKKLSAAPLGKNSQ